MHESDSSEWNKSAESRAKKSKKIKCECGKVYKSQASLTTHIKMHHNGAPASSRSQDKPARGRPKQYQYKQLGEHQDAVNPLAQLKQMDDKKVDQELNAKDIYERQPVYRLIYKYIQQQDPQIGLKFNEEDKIYEVTLGNGLAFLIQQLEQAIENKEFMHQLILLITIYTSYVIEETEDQNVLNNGNVGLLPEFANLFIIHDLIKRCDRLKLTTTWLGDSLKVIQVLSILFRWLIFKKFTHTKAIPNEDYSSRDEPVSE